MLKTLRSRARSRVSGAPLAGLVAPPRSNHSRIVVASADDPPRRRRIRPLPRLSLRFIPAQPIETSAASRRAGRRDRRPSRRPYSATSASACTGVTRSRTSAAHRSCAVHVVAAPSSPPRSRGSVYWSVLTPRTHPLRGARIDLGESPVRRSRASRRTRVWEPRGGAVIDGRDPVRETPCVENQRVTCARERAADLLVALSSAPTIGRLVDLAPGGSRPPPRRRRACGRLERLPSAPACHSRRAHAQVGRGGPVRRPRRAAEAARDRADFRTPATRR